MNYYVVSIVPRIGTTEAQEEEALNLAVDWYRFAKGQYVIYDNDDASTWRQLLGDLVEGGGQVFVCRLDLTDRAGWMKRPFWDWLRRPRPEAE